jgi:AcrR family transcriptional regulator
MEATVGGTHARTPGRPATIQPDEVARAAMALFNAAGYYDTSMADIARAAGIGRKSLYRYFATKADLVWGGMEPALQASLQALDAATAEPAGPRNPLACLADASTAGAAALPDLALTRARLRLIAGHSELLSHSHQALGAQRGRTLAYLTAAGVPGDVAGYLSAAFIAATFQAWLEWAAGVEPDPAPYLRAAARVLRLPASQQNFQFGE